MKKFRAVVFAIVCFVSVPFLCALSGCAAFGLEPTTAISVERIAKTKTEGLVDTYTIYYSDGSTSQFEVKNGEKGEQGETGKADIEQIWLKYKEKTQSEISFEDFVDEFLDFEAAQDNSKVVAECLLSAVKICCKVEVTTSSWSFGKKSTTTSIAACRGSGIVYRIDEDYAYIVTNYHVMNYYPSLSSGQTLESVELKQCVGWLYGCGGSFEGVYDINKVLIDLSYDDYAFEMEYVGGSITSDIAIARVPKSVIKETNSAVKGVEVADDYYVGETAIAIGNPEDAGISVTEGVVSVYSEYVKLALDNQERWYRSMRIDTSIYSGSSGGGLFNKYGKLIGITNSGAGSDENINWAVPIQIVSSVADGIIRNSSETADGSTKAQKVVVGVTTEPKNTNYIFDSEHGRGQLVEDILLTSVENDSIAKTLGLEAGQYVTKLIINGTEHILNKQFQLGDLLKTVTTGDKISFEYIDGTETKTTEEYTILESDLVEIE